ncbi:MAG TPA: carbamoyltransferase HypF [bacterium]
MKKRLRIHIQGIVQGVGFRPFVYRTAHDLGLAGFVRNTTAGVDIEAEGTAPALARFLDRLIELKPPAARIDEITKIILPLCHDKEFKIRKSVAAQGFTQLSPDIAMCRQCFEEFSRPSDRRYHFPFINCTNCGPRYAIIQAAPYDRSRTSMRRFKMCADCAAEFENMGDRRFHAQPDCCYVCGPAFEIHAMNGKVLKTVDPIVTAAELLKRGRIIAVKGIGGFHIACDATNRHAVQKLRRLKHRPTKPFAVMAALRDVPGIARVNEMERTVLVSPAAPVVLLEKRHRLVCDEVAPQNPYIGVMLPYAPVHHTLLKAVPYLVMTSGNIQDEPIVIDDQQVRQKLGRIVSGYLTHDRAIINRCDDSVGLVLPRHGFSIIRRSRGYVPVPVQLPLRVKPTLAMGPLLKNTFTLAHKKDAYVSPHIGDLDNLETLDFFKEMIRKYKRWFKIEPDLIIHDLHPDYMSTRVAQSLKGRKVGVQHHIAHIAACLGENNVQGPAIGIAFDGTGYGLDNRIWGGEFFVGTMNDLQRAAHLEYLPLPGGEESIKKPFRIALAYLYKNGLAYPAVLAELARGQQTAIERMIDTKYNLAWTSSMGRLFDCVSAMLGLQKEITYEAEAAIRLEHIAGRGAAGSYPYELVANETIMVKVAPLLRAILSDIENGVKAPVISARFHNTVAGFSLDIARKLRRLYGMNSVALSGGVFQNRYLLVMMASVLKRAGFKVYLHKYLPTNDGCISYGQVIYGNR